MDEGRGGGSESAGLDRGVENWRVGLRRIVLAMCDEAQCIELRLVDGRRAEDLGATFEDDALSG